MIDTVSVNTQQDESIAVTIDGIGTLDFSNYSDFRDKLESMSRESDRVIVDLRKADFIDTAVIQSLAKAAIALINRESRLVVLVEKTAYPYEVLKLSGFKQIMDIEVGPWSM